MKSRLILQQGLMDGKVIKEETGSVVVAPSTTSTSAPPPTSSSPCSSAAASPLQVNSAPTGKENRRVGSPMAEIVTRSRTKVLTKDNVHTSSSSHRRTSESPKGRSDGGSATIARNDSRSCSPLNMRTERSSSHHHHHHSLLNGSSSASSYHSAIFSSPLINTSSSSLITSASNGGTVTVSTPSPPNGAPPNGTSSSRTSSNSSSGGSGGSSSGLSQNGRYVTKMKRFLGTLLHFGCDISPEVGDRVRSLVFNLVSGHLSIEEFHHSLQEVTSFPLRPFVLPFLRAHLPLLQREISHVARMAKQTPLSYIRSHDQLIFEGASSPGEPCDIFHSEAADMSLAARKRKASESFYENGESSDSGYISTPKRPHHGSLFSPPFFPQSSSSSSSAELREYYAAAYPALLSLHGHHHSETNTTATPTGTPTGGAAERPDRGASGGSAAAAAPKAPVPEDEWKNIHTMLNCILSMVQKTKSALGMLQNRHTEEPGREASPAGGAAAAAPWLRRPASAAPAFGVETSEDFKRQAGELIAQALRATEDRVAEVKRRAEEAVQEVKRQALVELQRAEARACEVVAAERARLERVLMDSRRGPVESVIVSERGVDAESCWNCGRKAHETCSGCNMARYCSAFCQHKDWENHHSACGRNSSNNENNSSNGREQRAGGAASAAPPMAAPSGASETKAHLQDSNNSNSPIDVSHPSPHNSGSPGSNN